ncbi:MAG: protein-L-isoaspartate O-methyltransferase [Hyphomonadaceae bacterium]
MMPEEEAARLMRFILDLRQAGVTDARALAMLERTPRAAYAPPHLQALAMEDRALPLAHGQIMSKPSLVGRMLAALDLAPEHAVLDIGAGSGFQAAAIASCARRVTTLDRWLDLIVSAREQIGRARLMNVAAHLADGLEGYAAEAPYDRIVLNGAVPEIPLALREQLAPGGIIVAPVQEGGREEGAARLVRLRKGEPEDLGPIAFAPLEPGLGAD